MSVAENEDFQGLETIQNLKKAFIPWFSLRSFRIKQTSTSSRQVYYGNVHSNRRRSGE
jgi:hypothetical protein